MVRRATGDGRGTHVDIHAYARITVLLLVEQLLRAAWSLPALVPHPAVEKAYQCLNSEAVMSALPSQRLLVTDAHAALAAASSAIRALSKVPYRACHMFFLLRGLSSCCVYELLCV